MMKTLDERIRERGQAAWRVKVIKVRTLVQELATGSLRDAPVDLTGKPPVWQCIDRLFSAIEDAGDEAAGEAAVKQFLSRYDKLITELESLGE